MKSTLLFSVLLAVQISYAQNVGINTITPQASLDVRGSHRFGGMNNYISFDSSGRIEWRNSNLYVPVTQSLMVHSAAADGLFYNNTAPVSGQLEYRNALGEPVFYTNFTNGNGYFKNFLGIGTTTPFTNLQIQSDNSNPVFINGASSLYLTWAENGIPRGYLGSYHGNAEDVDLGTFGANPTAKLHLATQGVPRLTVDATGNVGIGQLTPSEKLQVEGNISASSFKYAAPKLLYYSIPDVEFTAQNSSYLVFNTTAIGGAYISNAPGTGLLTAPVHLPHGARLVSLRFDFHDASVSQNLIGQLVLQNTTFFTPYTGIESTGSGGFNTQTINYNPGVLIDNQSFAYRISVSATTGAWNTADLRIVRVIIGYEMAEAQ
jgi:hypothetical protein